MRSGALPTPIVVEEAVGPDLAEDSIKSGITSLIVAYFSYLFYVL